MATVPLTRFRQEELPLAETVTIRVPRNLPALGWAAFRVAVAVERGRQPRLVDVITLLRFVVRRGG